MTAHEKQRDEQRQALSIVAGQLYKSLSHLQIAHDYNNRHTLGLELPPVRPLVELIEQCAKAHQAHG